MTDEGFYDGGDLEALADLPNYQSWISDLLSPSGSVLEVGAGIGSVTAAYRDRVDRLALVEPSQLYNTLAERFAADDAVTVVHGTLESALRSRPNWNGSFDGLLMVNVLEHVREDGDLLRACHAALRPGGRLMIAVPAMPWLYGTLDALVGHERRYTRTTLMRVVESAGFVVTRVTFFDALGMLPWVIAGRLLRQQSFNASAASLYDRLGVPLTRYVESVVPPPLGKNLALVAHRS